MVIISSASAQNFLGVDVKAVFEVAILHQIVPGFVD